MPNGREVVVGLATSHPKRPSDFDGGLHNSRKQNECFLPIHHSDVKSAVEPTDLSQAGPGGSSFGLCPDPTLKKRQERMAILVADCPRCGARRMSFDVQNSVLV